MKAKVYIIYIYLYTIRSFNDNGHYTFSISVNELFLNKVLIAFINGIIE